jgi:hypothetical protein
MAKPVETPARSPTQQTKKAGETIRLTAATITKLWGERKKLGKIKNGAGVVDRTAKVDIEDIR